MHLLQDHAEKNVKTRTMGPLSMWELELHWLKKCIAADKYGRGAIRGEEVYIIHISINEYLEETLFSTDFLVMPIVHVLY